jgi:carotenoid 1,2-hydratase
MKRIESPGLQHLPKGRLWRVALPARIAGQVIEGLKTLEDLPFYTRSQILTEAGSFMHESLDLTRFCQPWVQLLLPFRMPRMG